MFTLELIVLIFAIILPSILGIFLFLSLWFIMKELYSIMKKEKNKNIDS